LVRSSSPAKGPELIAEDGARYLDFVAGIAVNAWLQQPRVRESVRARWTRTDPCLEPLSHRTGEQLAAELAKSFAGQAFFCNSGAEANEGAVQVCPQVVEETRSLFILVSRLNAPSPHRSRLAGPLSL